MSSAERKCGWFKRYFDDRTFFRFLVSYALLLLLTLTLLLSFIVPRTLRAADDLDAAHSQALLDRVNAYLDDVFSEVEATKFKLEHTAWFHNLFIKVIAQKDALTLSEQDGIKAELLTFSTQVPDFIMVSFMLDGDNTLYNGAVISPKWESLQKYDTNLSFNYQFFPLNGAQSGLALVSYGPDQRYRALVYRATITNLFKTSYNRPKGEINITLNLDRIRSQVLARMGTEACAFRLLNKEGAPLMALVNGGAPHEGAQTFRKTNASNYHYELDIPASVRTQNRRDMMGTLAIVVASDMLLSLVLALILAWRNCQPIRRLSELLGGASDYTLLGEGVELLKRQNDAAGAKLRDAQRALRRRNIISLLSGDPATASWPESLCFRHPNFRVLSMRLPFSECFDGEEALIQASVAFEAVVNCLADDLALDAFLDSPLLDHCTLILNYQSKRALEDYLERLTSDLQKFFSGADNVIALGLSDKADAPERLAQLARHAAHALNQDSGPRGHILERYEDLPRGLTPDYHYPVAEELLLIGALRDGNREEALSLCLRILRDNSRRGNLAWPQIYCLYYDLLGTLLKALHALDLEPEAFLPAYQDERFINPIDMESHFENVISMICEAACRKAIAPEPQRLEDKLLAHVRAHLYDPALSQADMATAFGVSVSQVSTVFKEATGISYTEYVNQSRVNRAVELLEGGQQTLDEVARQVGYISTTTFRRNFIKYARTSPASVPQHLT